MFKVLLVESNYTRAAKIAGLIPWTEFLCSLTVDYNDVSALEKLRGLEPDIVIIPEDLPLVSIPQFVWISMEQNPNIRFIIFGDHTIPDSETGDHFIYLDNQNLTKESMIEALTKTLDKLSGRNREKAGTGEDEARDESRLQETLAAIGQRDIPAYLLLLKPKYGFREIDRDPLMGKIHSVLGEEGNGGFITNSGELCIIFRFVPQKSPLYSLKLLDQTMEKLLEGISRLIPYKKPVLLGELISDAFVAGVYRELRKNQNLSYFCRERAFLNSRQVLASCPVFDYDRCTALFPLLLAHILANRLVEAVCCIEEIYTGLLKPSMDLSGLDFIRDQIQMYLDLYGTIQGYPPGRTRLFLSGFSYLEEEEVYLSSFLEQVMHPFRKGAEFHPKILTALSIIERHYMEYLSLDDISGELGMTKAYFCTLFKQIVHQGYVEYLNKIRIYKALNLIRRGERRVEYLARSNGFSEPKYFCRVFKKIVGMPPSLYMETVGRGRSAANALISDAIKPWKTAKGR
ncbi:MAG: AraC family transcriptional regulator [Treponema sp.]|jgi:AraC-like DNA-binding protein|nr:AraC family transcriptional regulator [Treponema sp.]